MQKTKALLNKHKRGWMSRKTGEMKENSTLNWRSTSTNISIKKLQMFYAEVLTKDELEYEPDSLKSMLEALDLHLRWLQLPNYTRPWVFISVQVSARRISKTSSPARKMEDTERGKCTDKGRRRRNTLDGKNSRRFQSRSSFSHDVVESNWGQ